MHIWSTGLVYVVWTFPWLRSWRGSHEMLLHGRIAASRVPPKILTMVLRLRRCGRSLAALRIRCDPRSGSTCPAVSGVRILLLIRGGEGRIERVQ